MIGGWMTPRPAQVISGGQTGADQGALRAAYACGIPTGGWAPHGWRTETGPAPWLRTRYGLQEHAAAAYTPRTIANLRGADATILFGDVTTPGSRQTIAALRAAVRPYLINPTPETLAAWWTDLSTRPAPPRILNVAGNREGRHAHAHRWHAPSVGNPGIEAYVFWFLCRAWGHDTRQPSAWPREVWIPRPVARDAEEDRP